MDCMDGCKGEARDRYFIYLVRKIIRENQKFEKQSVTTKIMEVFGLPQGQMRLILS